MPRRPGNRPRPRPRPFTPFRAPTRPPPGTYDPSIDYGERAAERGFGDLQQDIERERGRQYTDVFDPRLGSIAELGRQRGDIMEDLGTSRGRSLQDLLTGKTRGLEDIGTARTRGEEDYGRSVEELQRSFRMLGGQQRQSQAAAGVRGGATAQAAAKRTENEAFERKPIDTGIERLRSDLLRDETRLGEDYTTQTGRVEEDYTRGVGRTERDYGLGVERETLGYQRGEEDRSIGLARGGRELGEYKLGLGPQRFFQAAQTGYEPPVKPANEFTKAGQTYQVQGRQGQPSQRTYTLPSGRQLNRGQWVGLIRRRRRQGG